MKIVNIWMNPPISDHYARCIETQRKYFSDCEYELVDSIAAAKLFTEANEEFSGVNSVEDYMTHPVPGSDYLRMYILSRDPGILYLDCDIEITGKIPYDFFKDRIAIDYMEKTDYYCNGMMYNGNDCESFLRLCRYWFRQKQLHAIHGAINKFGHDANCQKILPDWYTHYMFTSRG